VGQGEKKTPLSSPILAFFHMMPLGINGCRYEIILMAFAQALATRSSDGHYWLKGGDIISDLPQELISKMRKSDQGRFFAFKVSDNL
jgi:hypothetical protein